MNQSFLKVKKQFGKKMARPIKTKRLIILCLALFGSLLSLKLSTAEYGDIILNSKYKSLRKHGVMDVKFPHWFHRIRFKCKVCHEDIFIIKAGANDIDMTKILNGEKCGKCHNGIIAWEPMHCPRCHAQEPGWKPGPIQKSMKEPIKDEERQRYLDGGVEPWNKGKKK